MLRGLHIENIAVIEKAGIDFDSGLNVLTGETGAGKSMVIDAINAVLGERISRDAVRTGSEQARVTAMFADLSAGCAARLDELGYPPDEEGCLLIQRTVAAEGKGGCRINGQPVTVSLLREIGRLLVNIHGQHENQALLSCERHVDYLERMGGLQPQRAAYEGAHRAWREACRQLAAADMDEGEKARRIDTLRYQIEEITAAGLRPGEQAELAERRELCRHAEKVARGLAVARACLAGGEDSDGALALLAQAAEQAEEAARYVRDVEGLTGRLRSAQYDLEECAAELREYAGRLEIEPGELEQVEQRLDILRRLTAKYGGDEEAVLAFLERAEQELEGIELSGLRRAGLEKECAAAAAAMEDCAAALTAARTKAAAALERDVGAQLVFLDMPDVRLTVSIDRQEPGSTGADRVEFLISANPGEQPKSIAKIASGGELSRIMLAIKAVMADADDIDTLVFDEIDTGISGRAALKIGQKLRETAGTRQVLCVTHLAAIAAQADHQYLIEKTVRDERTFTDVTKLDREGRLREIARIIGGEVTTAALDAAREMLERQ